MYIFFMSLGCDKNLVDSEEMLGALVSHGFEVTDDESQADPRDMKNIYID